jgi:hypothetical protein
MTVKVTGVTPSQKTICVVVALSVVDCIVAVIVVVIVVVVVAVVVVMVVVVTISITAPIDEATAIQRIAYSSLKAHRRIIHELSKKSSHIG